MNKKRLNFLSFPVVKAVCLLLMDGWMEDNVEDEPAVDRDFLVALRDLRALADRDKEHRNVVCSRLQVRCPKVSGDVAATISYPRPCLS